MRKFFVFGLLSLFILSSAVIASTDINQNISKKLKFCPKPFLNATFTCFWHRRDGFGMNILGFDVALLKYRAFYFLDFGIGLGAFWEAKLEWVRYGYSSWRLSEDRQLIKVFHVLAEGWAKRKNCYFSPYLKFSPVKIPMNITKNMRDRVFLDIGIFSQKLKKIDGITVGLSFSFDIFKDK